MPPKLKDPGSFSIPCVIGKYVIDMAICDLGASISLMPMSICEKLKLGELRPTKMSIQFADRSVKYPLGILENVPVRVGQFVIPTDFIVMDIREDSNTPIILGRPFLATADALIDVKKGKLTFEVGEEKVEFILTQLMKAPVIDNECYMLDVIEECRKEMDQTTYSEALKTLTPTPQTHESDNDSLGKCLEITQEPPPYKPPIPYPQRFVKPKNPGQFEQFIEILKKLYIDIPFIEATTQIPSYVKFLKEILSKKRKLEDTGTVECNAISENKLTPKLEDP
jgi:hypothetical protein